MKTLILVLLIWAPIFLRAESAPNPLALQMQDAVVGHPNIAEVRRILDLGFDPNSSIGCGEYPAILGAVEHRDIEMARLLLERGSKVPDQAMLICCNTSDMETTLVRLLVEHGGNVNSKQSNYYSCLHGAVARDNFPLVEYLLKTKGIDINTVCQDGPNEGTPLMWALRSGKTELASLLLTAGADTKIKSESGLTAASIISDRLNAYEKLRAIVANPRS